MANMKVTPSNYSEAMKALGGRDERVIGHNTKLEYRNGSVLATYHGNAIVRYAQDGVWASWAGWATSTTANRLNQLAPARFNIKGREPHINGVKLEDWDEWVKVDS